MLYFFPMHEIVYYDMLGARGLATTLPSQVARELGRRIVSGVYRAGDLVEDENAVGKRFQVSRTVVREAAKILESKGLVSVRRGIGTRVEPRQAWRLLDKDVLAWHQAASPCAETLSQLAEMRTAIEPCAARWAARRADADDLREIENAVDQMKQAAADSDDVDAFVVADAGFHRAVLKAARNDFLAALEGVIYAALLTSIRITNSAAADNEKSVPFHRAVARAIAAGDEDLAEKQMRRLLDDARKRLQKRLAAAAAAASA